MKQPRVDRLLFIAASSAAIAASIPLGLFPEQSGQFISTLYGWIASNIGVLYQLFGFSVIGFLLWLSFSHYGKIRLGGEGDKPDYSLFSWIGMLFCAGTGASLLVWSGVEWAYYIDSPPLGAEPRSVAAIEWAAAYGPFHWGVTAWAIYALPTIAIAYQFYVKRVPHLRASTSLHSILGPRGENSIIGRMVDLAAMIALLGGAGTSLGVIAPTIAASVAELLNMDSSFTLEFVVMSVCIALFGGSVYLGLDKGIRRLSDLNVYLMLGLLLFVLVTGPTLFIVKVSLNTLGVMTQNFVRMMTWTDPVTQSGFVEAWSIFYWAWWVAFALPIGVFVTRISRGRTIRQVILGMLTFGSAGCWLFYFILGSYSLSLELDGVLSVTGALHENGMYVAVASVISTLPWSNFALALFVIVSAISVATTYDSASYTLASTATTEIKEGENPARWHRVFWAFILGLLPLFMMFVGGLDIIRSGVLVASLPMLAVSVAIVFALMKSLREHESM